MHGLTWSPSALRTRAGASRVAAVIGGLGLLHMPVIRPQIHRNHSAVTDVEGRQIRWAPAPGGRR